MLSKFWTLKFVICLEFGAWDLEFPACGRDMGMQGIDNKNS